MIRDSFPTTHLFAFTFAVSLVIAAQSAIAIAASRETYNHAVAHMTPQIAILFVMDAMSKGLAICGILAFRMRPSANDERSCRHSEYLWPLLGLVIAMKLLSGFWTYAPVGLTHILGGAVAMYFARSIYWKCLYLLFAFSPFVLMASYWGLAKAVTPLPFYVTQLLPCANEIVICSWLGVCNYGTKPNFVAWGGIISQFALTSVTVIFVSLIYLGMLG